VTIDLRRGVCAQEGSKLVVIKQVSGRWRIVGWGVLKGGKTLLD
ncbi:MAG: translation initiation factor IF-2 subunit gamma, partial [Caldivirga sp.]|nr:translation initiation factor IF-2 subunit gamma [Caldivirga sp.]